MMNKDITDEMLVELHKKGDECAFEELNRRYVRLINAFARSYFLLGGDEDDIRQEASYGLFQAIAGYDPSKGKFSTFAYLCMNRRVLNLIKEANGEKHKALNESYPILIYESQMQSPELPEDMIIRRESASELMKKMQETLSKFEYKIFIAFFVEGINYRVIAQEFGVEPKKIDNTVQRIKVKLRKLYQE